MKKHSLYAGAKLLYDTTAYNTVLFADVSFGSALEGKKRIGAAHFIEHLLFTKSKKYSRQQISYNIESTGSITNAYTKKETTAYFIKGLPDFFEKNADILFDCLFDCVFDKDEIETERKIILNEIKEIKDNPAKLSFQRFLANLYYKHPLGFETVGTEETINKMKRADLVKEYKKFYKPKNFVFAVNSTLGEKSIIATINHKIQAKYTNNFRESHQSDKRRNKRIAFNLSSWNARNEEIRKPIEQTHICLGFPFNPNLHYQATFSLVSTMLGEGLSSILVKELREKHGLCYDVHSFVEGDLNHAYFCVYLATIPKNQAKALKIINSKFDELRQGKLIDKQLSRARVYFKGKQLIAREDSLIKAEQNAYAHRFGFNSFDAFLDFIVNQRKKEIQEICKVGIPEEFTVVSICPDK